jgi:CRISPR/Cas system-associated exonuclease Cas4 (RecB family)
LWEQSDRTEDVFTAFETAYDFYITEARTRQPDLDQWIIPPIAKDVEKSIASYRKRGLEKDVVNYKTFCEEAEWEVYRFPDGEKALELSLEFEVGGILVKGAIDALHYWPDRDVITLTDIKSGNLEEWDARQLGVYAYAVGVQYGLEIKHGRYFFTKSNKIGGWHDLSRYDEPYLSDLFQSLDRVVGEGLFLPSPGDHCKLCGVRPQCREQGDKDKIIELSR